MLLLHDGMLCDTVISRATLLWRVWRGVLAWIQVTQLFRLFFSLGHQLLFGMSTLLLLISLFPVIFLSQLKFPLPSQNLSFNFYRKLNCLSDFCRTFYWILTYGGYAGDLSPKSSFELLKGDRNAVLIDIRPEARHCIFIKSHISAG